MPSLGADMEHGMLLEWRVSVGDRVERGDIIAEVDTDKSAVEIEVFQTGTVTRLLVEPGTEVPVGTPLALIDTGVAAEPTPSEPTRAEPTPSAPSAARRPDAEPTPAPRSGVLSPLVRRRARELGIDTAAIAGTGLGGRIRREDVERAAALVEQGAAPPAGRAAPGPGGPVAHGEVTRRRASPLARRRARELGVDVNSISGTGPTGAVVARDVVDAARRGDVSVAPPHDAPSAPDRTESPLPGDTPADGTARTVPAMDAASRAVAVRAAIARLMSTANREIPHYHVTSTFDFATADEWLRRHNADLPPTKRILPAAVLLRATALAAVRHTELNGFWVDGTFEAADGVHLGVAIALRGGGLITPALRDADRFGLTETMERLSDLVARTRRGSLRGSEMAGGSMTVTNLGSRGADAVFGVIHPPQVALVGFGRIVDRPWAVDGMVGVRPVLTATLSGDHRATDGHVGSLFLETIDALIQNPDRLCTEGDRPE